MDNRGYRESTDHQEKAVKVSEAEALKALTDQPPVSDVEFGSGWYHDVAIKESAERVSRKH